MVAGWRRETSWPVSRWLSPPGPAAAGRGMRRGARAAARVVTEGARVDGVGAAGL
jgi:hypothetical protein